MSSSSDSGSEDAVPFALSPAQSYAGVIDFRSSGGRKLYEHATAKLSDELFDCNPGDLYQFLKNLEDRARSYGWDDGILTIAEDPNDPNTEYSSLLSDYGQIDLETIRAFDKTYLAGQSRAAQDSNMMYTCIMNSIYKIGKAKIRIWEDEYKVDNHVSGNLLLKIVVRESHLDTNATTSTIRTKLSELDSYLPTIGSDISKFNQYVALLLAALKSRGEKTEDLLTNLFKGYLAASDKVFVEYIRRKQESYEDGENITAPHLMTQADNKYKTLLQKNKWNAPNESEEKILALEAELKAMKRAHKRDSNKGGTSDPTLKGKDNKRPEWLFKHKCPKDADLTKPHEWKRHLYYYCHKDTGGKCSGKWRTHKPKACEGKEWGNVPLRTLLNQITKRAR